MFDFLKVTCQHGMSFFIVESGICVKWPIEYPEKSEKATIPVINICSLSIPMISEIMKLARCTASIFDKISVLLKNSF